MKKEEVLQSVSKKKFVVGEMETAKTKSGGLIALLVSGVLAVALIIAEFSQLHKTGGFAIATICYTWASVQYFLQYFMAHRPWQVLIGAILDGLAAVACLVFYILFSVGVL